MDNECIVKLKEQIAASESIVFFGGAGVSTESGIPDFRSENGIFAAIEKFGERPEVLLSHGFFMRRTERFFDYYRDSLLVTDVQPNPAHYALARLEAQGRLKAVVTQNIDGLHQKAGSKVIYELHGSIYRNHCMKCGKAFGAEYIKTAQGVPHCDCGGIVKPDVVLYEEGLDDATVRGAINSIMKADMLIIGGTSLAVYPAAGLINYFDGERLVLINKSETPYDGRAGLIIHRAIGEVLSAAVE